MPRTAGDIDRGADFATPSTSQSSVANPVSLVAVRIIVFGNASSKRLAGWNDSNGTLMPPKAKMNVQGFLDSAGVTKTVIEIRPRETIFRQGDPSTDILYIQNGRVKISVLNKAG